MQSYFLSEADIQKLTGFVRPSAQCKWLQEHGWLYDINGLGKPVVARIEVERRLAGKNPTNQTRKEPNWGALNG